MQIDATVALSQFVGSLPTFIAVILAWLQSNARISDTNARFDKRLDDFAKRLDDVRDLIRTESQATRSELRAELRRVEEVMDARLKHLEENQ
jgi:hypothetical protein